MTTHISKKHFTKTLIGMAVLLTVLSYGCNDSTKETETTNSTTTTTTDTMMKMGTDTMMKMNADTIKKDTSKKGGQPTPTGN